MKDWTSGEYKFQKPDENCSRSPCPALNALANHNILPHSGKELSFWQVVKAIREVYNLGLGVALLFTIGGFVLCGHRMRTRLDLHELARHGRVEHNGSLTHDDVPDGTEWAPCPVNPELLELFVKQGEDKQVGDGANGAGGEGNGTTPPSNGTTRNAMTLHDILEARLRRLGEIQTARKPPLSKFHRIIMNGESALTFLLFKDGEGKIDREMVRIWFGEERLPGDWRGDVSGQRIGLVHMNAVAGKLNKLEAARGK